jgi:hypothetical protein
MKTISQSQIKVRRSWGQLNPATKRIESKKTFSRKQKFNSKWYGYENN